MTSEILGLFWTNPKTGAPRFVGRSAAYSGRFSQGADSALAASKKRQQQYWRGNNGAPSRPRRGRQYGGRFSRRVPLRIDGASGVAPVDSQELPEDFKGLPSWLEPGAAHTTPSPPSDCSRRQ
ncbi:hypothetical protein ON010_g13880 [Phytophthora cinnamomi]|nr:hypothetical protein ON010_g13880 [Phytophthora cinnamomi]